MNTELKKTYIFTLVIGLVLLFTFTLADTVNTLGEVKAPWLHRTEQDLINELRMEINNIRWEMAFLAEENRSLRILVYTVGPTTMVTCLKLADECKKLQQQVNSQKTKIRILELKLRIRQWQMPAPYQREG